MILPRLSPSYELNIVFKTVSSLGNLFGRILVLISKFEKHYSNFSTYVCACVCVCLCVRVCVWVCVCLIQKSTDQDVLTDVVVSLEFGGADVEMDVALSVVHFSCEKIARQGSNLRRPGSGPHQHLKKIFIFNHKSYFIRT